MMSLAVKKISRDIEILTPLAYFLNAAAAAFFTFLFIFASTLYKMHASQVINLPLLDVIIYYLPIRL